MKRKIEYLKVKFVLGSITLIMGLIAANIALFKWVEKTGVQYLFGNYSRYILGFGGFAAMIFGTMLINDVWVLNNVLIGKYDLPSPQIVRKHKSKTSSPKKKGRRKKRIKEKKLRIAILLLIISSLLSPTAVFSIISYTATVNITVKSSLIYYLHRTDVSGVTPAGKLMNTTQPPANQSETTYQINRGSSAYFYTQTLSAGSIENGTWTLYIWASTVSSGKVSRLTVQIHLVSSDGSTEKTTIGTITDVIIDYGYSERTVTISGNAATAASGDRIRLTLYAQTGATNDAKGMSFYYDGYGTYQTLGHETRLQPA